MSGLTADSFRETLEQAIERSEVLQRRFRHCAARSLMILRSYMGRTKKAGRMHISSKILFNAVKRISNQFPILKEARREVLEDLMDCEHAQWVIAQVSQKNIIVEEVETTTPSPFAFALIAGGYSDVIKIEEKQEFLRRMHEQVLAQIALKKGKKILKQKQEEFSYAKYWEEQQQEKESAKDAKQEQLKMQVWNLKHVPVYAKEELVKLIETGSMKKEIWDGIKEHWADIEQNWPPELKGLVKEKMSTN